MMDGGSGEGRGKVDRRGRNKRTLFTLLEVG